MKREVFSNPNGATEHFTSACDHQNQLFSFCASHGICISQDILDLGNGMPLFEKFQYEDWTLLSTRYELHLLLHSFKKDLEDPDRPSFGEPQLNGNFECVNFMFLLRSCFFIKWHDNMQPEEKHLSYYYQKYFKKAWDLKILKLAWLKVWLT